jgi:DNA-binding response OmpR family regulator
MSKILLVEDDNALADSLTYYLKNEGFEITICNNIENAKKAFDNKFDLIILDINLPDGSGYDFCTYVRKQIDIPIIFLTALDEEENIVKGLEIGADDYIIKPFKARELVSRIKSLLRRTNKSIDDIINIKNIKVDLKLFRVYKDDKEVEMTSLEYKLLLYLLKNKNQVLTREQILKEMWDDEGKFVNDNTLTVYIKRIRKKLDDKIIKTVKAVGYIVEDSNVKK